MKNRLFGDLLLLGSQLITIKNILGGHLGDKGYIGQTLFDLLFKDGIQSITKLSKNMKQRNLGETEQILLHKGAVIESVNDELNNICRLQHTSHRLVNGFLFNVMSALAAYFFLQKKSSINIKDGTF